MDDNNYKFNSDPTKPTATSIVREDRNSQPMEDNAKWSCHVFMIVMLKQNPPLTLVEI